jgi:hypothetical protein
VPKNLRENNRACIKEKHSEFNFCDFIVNFDCVLMNLKLIPMSSINSWLDSQEDDSGALCDLFKSLLSTKR